MTQEPETLSPTDQRLDIIGGGISGLSTAYYALKNGVPAEQIHVHESSDRLGGKILSAQLNGHAVNRGAEFIDSAHDGILAMCSDLGVKLNASSDQGTLEFHMPNGKTLSQDEFFKAYRPIFEEIQRDKKELKSAPDGRLAQRLNTLSLEAYMQELAGRVAPPERTFWEKCVDTVTFHTPKVDPAVFQMAMGCYESEAGQKGENVNAKQFVDEASDEMDRMFSSDCAYRVDGGTEQIIHKLHAALQAAGVNFHLNQVATKITHAEGKNEITFAGQDAPTQTDRVVLALPAYRLKQIDGLEQLGMSPEQLKLISEAQYTNSIKFTVKLKDGVTAPELNFYSAMGFQCWSDTPGLMTFLASNAGMERLGVSLPQYVNTCLDTFATTHGTTREAMFGDLRGNMVLTNPVASPCYASPAKNQQRELYNFGHSLDALEKKGLSIAGTFIPNRTQDGTEVGFMECGIKSAERAIENLLAPQRQAEYWQGMVTQKSQQAGVGQVTLVA